MGTRLLAAAGVLLLAGATLWMWAARPRAGRSEPADAPRVVALPPARAASSNAAKLPRLQTAPTLADEPPPMSEGLAQDLEIFDGTQLRAELESIALSHDGVTIVEAICTGLPCRAEVRGNDLVALQAFILAVRQRFGGHVSARAEPRRPADPSGAKRIVLWVGTRERSEPAVARPG